MPNRVLIFYYTPIVFLGFPVWVPSNVPFNVGIMEKKMRTIILYWGIYRVI